MKVEELIQKLFDAEQKIIKLEAAQAEQANQEPVAYAVVQQELFDMMVENHGITLMQSQMNDIIQICAMLNAAPTPNTITIPADEYERLKKDAERYRWLRENYKFADGIWAVVACQQNKHLVDDAVDQAMEGKS